jgi:hypothetical protein
MALPALTNSFFAPLYSTPLHIFVNQQGSSFSDNFTSCTPELRLPAERFALAACCHENQLSKRDQLFERKKALKRNVATRQPASFVRRF